MVTGEWFRYGLSPTMLGLPKDVLVGHGGGEEQGERGGRLAGGRKRERGEWEGLSKLGTGSKLHWKLKVNK